MLCNERDDSKLRVGAWYSKCSSDIRSNQQLPRYQNSQRSSHANVPTKPVCVTHHTKPKSITDYQTTHTSSSWDPTTVPPYRTLKTAYPQTSPFSSSTSSYNRDTDSSPPDGYQCYRKPPESAHSLSSSNTRSTSPARAGETGADAPRSPGSACSVYIDIDIHH